MRPNDFEQRLLYGIVDLSYVEVANTPAVVDAMIAGGVDIVQLRGKKHDIEKLKTLAAELHSITAKHQVPLIINDHPQIARSVPLEGVHVGQDDLSIAQAREIAGRELVIGKSTHSLEQAVAAEKEGADYIGLGPLFATPTKPDYAPIGLDAIRRVHEAVRIPIFCIGGIKLDNLIQVIAAGAQRVVIVSGLLQSKNIEAYAETAKRALLASRAALK